MNVTAIERMEEFARSVLKLPTELQAQYFEEMVASGTLTANEAKGLMEYVAYFHMFTDQRYYNAVRAGVYEMYMSESAC